MPSPSDPAVRDFIGRSMIVELATSSPKQRPFLTPLWFVFDGEALYMTTGPETRAARNVARNPEVALLFGDEGNGRGGRLLRVRGTATRHHGLPSWRVLVRVAAKYYVAPGALAVELRNARKWPLRMRYYGQTKGGFGYLRVVPVSAEFLARP